MSKFNSRSRKRFASMRKRRAFGPRRSSRFIKVKHYAKHVRGPFSMEIGSIERFRFLTSVIDSADAMAYMLTAIPREHGKSTFAEQWKLATVAAEVAGRLYEDGDDAADLRAWSEKYDRAVYEAVKARGAAIANEQRDNAELVNLPPAPIVKRTPPE